MRRRIYHFAGACGLIITVNALGQTGGTAATGPTTSGTAPVVAAPASSSRGTAVAPSGTASSVATAGAARAGAQPVVQSGQNLTVSPGQSLTSPTGPTVTAQQGTGIVPGQTPAAQTQTLAPGSQTISPAQATGPGVAATSTAQPTGGVIPVNAVAQPVLFNALPATIQTALQAQLASGAQVGGIQQLNTSQGTIFRAQVMRNGVVSDAFFNTAGAPLSGATVSTMLAAPGAAPVGTVTATTGTTTADPFAANLQVAGSSGFVPLNWAALPPAVQSAFTAQAGGQPVDNLTFTRGPSGGVFSGMANGQPVQVRVGPTGLPLAAGAAPAADAGRGSERDTNTVTLDELPMAVRDVLRDEMPHAKVSEIRRVESPDGDIFQIYSREEGRHTEIHITENGTVVREATELPVVVSDTAPVNTNLPPKLEWRSLPIAVKDAVEAHSSSERVRSLVLTNHEGKTAYAVDYVEDSLRHRLFVDKEGRIMGVQTNIHRATPDLATNRRPILIEDLPTAARATVEEVATASTVTRIELAMNGAEPVYNVQYLEDGESRVLSVTPEGLRVDAVGSAPPGVSGRHEYRD